MTMLKYVPTSCLGPKLAEADLEKLEKALPKNLPGDYRSFLMEYLTFCKID